MADPVSIVVWRDAVTDPPGDARPVITDAGLLWYASEHIVSDPGWRGLGGGLVAAPSFWCDPTLPSDPSERLTTNHLRATERACRLVAESIRKFPEDATAEQTVAAGMHQVGPENADEWDETAARLRASLPGEEGGHANHEGS